MRISDWSSDVCSSDLASIYDDGLSGDVPAGVASQPQHGTDEVVDGALVGQRRVASQPRAALLVVVELVGDLAAEEAGGDGVHAERVTGPLHREPGRQPAQTTLHARERGNRKSGLAGNSGAERVGQVG